MYLYLQALCWDDDTEPRASMMWIVCPVERRCGLYSVHNIYHRKQGESRYINVLIARGQGFMAVNKLSPRAKSEDKICHPVGYIIVAAWVAMVHAEWDTWVIRLVKRLVGKVTQQRTSFTLASNIRFQQRLEILTWYLHNHTPNVCKNLGSTHH